MKRTLLILSLFLMLISCDIYEQDEYQELVVLEAYMVAGRDLPVVRVSRTLPSDVEYTFEEAGLSGAFVQIVLLDENGDDESLFSYEPAVSEPGFYLPSPTDHRVLAERTYRIDVAFNNRDEVLRSETTIPEQIEIINEVKESVVYQSDDRLEVIINATQNSSRKVYLFDTIAQEPSEENLTPFYRAAFDGGDVELDELTSNSSGLINEGNFTFLDDGSISILFPWIGVAFYGENRVITNSVDPNLADLIRSQSVQLGGSTLPPGEIPNLIYNIEGGIGVFGSISSDTVTTRFLRPNESR